MKLIDLSQPVYDGCPNYPGDPRVISEAIACHEKDGWLVEQLSLTPHTGSHVDAPAHKIAGGPTIDQLPLEKFTGLAVMADLRECQPAQPFTSSMLSRKLRAMLEDRIVLLATGWGQLRGVSDDWAKRPPYVSPDGAEWLVEQQIRGVGIDTLSIGGVREEQNRLTHELLLGGGCWILEDLRFPEELFAVNQPFQVWCLPMHLRGHSGAFCRPVAVLPET